MEELTDSILSDEEICRVRVPTIVWTWTTWSTTTYTHWM